MKKAKRTKREISELRKAFRMEYERFRTNFKDISIRFGELCIQADELLDFLEKLNELPEGL